MKPKKQSVTKEVTDHVDLYRTLREVLPKRGTAILGLQYTSKDGKIRNNNILVGADMVSFAQRKGIPVKTREELDKMNNVHYREGCFTFGENGTVAIEGIQMNNRVPGVTATIFVIKWITSVSYKGITYQVKEVPKRSAHAFVTKVNNGYTKIQFPDKTKYIIKTVFGQKGDKVSYCPKRKTFMNLETKDVLEEKYFVKKGSPEYLDMKKKLNGIVTPKQEEKTRVFLKEGVPLVVGKPIEIVAQGSGGRSLFRETMESAKVWG